MTWYLTLRSDEQHARSTPSGPLVALLAGWSELRQTGPQAFEGAPGSPWVHVILAFGQGGDYAVTGALLPEINVVELICSDDADQRWYDALAIRIATFLAWEAVEEAAGRRVWSPGAA